jgi:hypothetical protein
MQKLASAACLRDWLAGLKDMGGMIALSQVIQKRSDGLSQGAVR